MTRAYVNSDRIEHLERTLSSKELAILVTLDEVRLASATQLERLHFHGDTARNRRRVLQSLADRGLIERLERDVGGRGSGSESYLYAQGIAGRRILHRETGQRVRRPTTPGAPFISHTLALTELFVRLREAERAGHVELVTFESEPRSWRKFAGPGSTLTCKPDAYVRTALGEYIDDRFIECDLGSEGPKAVNRQLEIYRRYWASGLEQNRRGVFPQVLWLVPNEHRYQWLVDLISRQPAETWQIHLVTLYDNAVALMTEGTS